MPAAPLVSVLLAVSNGERYLRAALESILRQTVSDLELIVVDDGSTDGHSGRFSRPSTTRGCACFGTRSGRASLRRSTAGSTRLADATSPGSTPTTSRFRGGSSGS